MEPTEAAVVTTPTPSILRQSVRFGLHLLAVYAIVNITTMWLAGFVHGRFLPLLQQHSPTVSSLQFAFSHLFVFSFYPAAALGFLYAHWYRHKVACFVWIVPPAILAYKFIDFPSNASVLSASKSQFAAAFHHYISGNFMISEFHSYGELFDLAAANPDMSRGMDQYHYTAPLYAAIGYSVGTLIGINCSTPKLHATIDLLKPRMSPGK